MSGELAVRHGAAGTPKAAVTVLNNALKTAFQQELIKSMNIEMK